MQKEKEKHKLLNVLKLSYIVELFRTFTDIFVFSF